jgi:hypothetical protein
MVASELPCAKNIRRATAPSRANFPACFRGAVDVFCTYRGVAEFQESYILHRGNFLIGSSPG